MATIVENLTGTCYIFIFKKKPHPDLTVLRINWESELLSWKQAAEVRRGWETKD